MVFVPIIDVLGIAMKLKLTQLKMVACKVAVAKLIPEL